MYMQVTGIINDIMYMTQRKCFYYDDDSTTIVNTPARDRAGMAYFDIEKFYFFYISIGKVLDK